MMRKLAFAGAALAMLPGAAMAQDVALDPIEAKQCAVWASMFSTQFEDEETRQAFIYAVNYFVGYYEGTTGQGIGDLEDEESIAAVETRFADFSQICGAHMQGFGTRMSAWGEWLSQFGSETAQDAK
ncbi:hypothetical protein GCM10009127_17540 [Alteraurantiacibacter aestuarii]|uniref:Uncharacterized protein n=1 Tax=Alteraurantiacibacter aestuarii TaxID=650004 RepID=A0A844ZKX2_9SPHN|nr:hypothetical protein [Alteraurantiacibacter aestuarii]MXO87660.1 hypothetical protein [Alteraurantiacibacter aestuarii]